MTESVNIIVDDIKVSVPKGLMAVDAAKRAGIKIPVFCYHPKLPAVGMCRMCLVEIGTPKTDPATKQVVRDDKGEAVINWMPKLQTACTTPVSEGMGIRTNSGKVKDAQREILEFLLTSHPLDCPICQKGGECPLQNLTIAFGPGTSRFPFDRKMDLDKRKPLGDLIFLDEERCIQCSRCIRFQDELAEDHVLAFDQRGRSLQIATFSEPGFDSVFSGNTTDICPVGALLSADYHYSARPWELKPVPSICTHCPVGCNLTLNTRVNDNYIARIMPRQNEQVNEIWICDKGRFAYDFATSPERLTRPLVRKGGELVESTWDEAIALVADKLKSAGALSGAIAGERLSNEDLYVLQALMRQGLGSHNLDHWPNTLGGAELVAQVGLARGSNISEWGPGTAVLVIASDLEQEAPIWWLRVNGAAKRGATLVVANGRPTKSDNHAAFKLRYRYGDEVHTLNSLLAAVLSGGLENKEFAARVDGLSELRMQLAQIQTAGGRPSPEEVQADAAAGELRERLDRTNPAGTPSGKPGPALQPSDLAAAAKALAEAQNLVIIYGGEGLSYEASQALAQTAANLLIVTGHVGRPHNGLLPVWSHANTQGAWDMGMRPDLLPGYQPAPHPGKDAAAMLSAQSEMLALFVAGADPAADDPATIPALKKLEFLVVSELFMTETARLAHVVLPVQSFVEREGTFTNGERHVQRYYAGLPPRRSARPDWQIFAQIGARLGVHIPSASAAQVMAHIAKNVPAYAGLTYTALSQYTAQYPDVGGRDLYYGGTAYRNTGGLGVTWPAGAEADGHRAQVRFAVAPVPAGSGLRVVPITRLYRPGTTVTAGASDRTPLLARIPAPYLEINSADAARMGIDQGDMLTVQWGGRRLHVAARVDGTAPEGAALLPSGLLGIGLLRGTTIAPITRAAQAQKV